MLNLVICNIFAAVAIIAQSGQSVSSYYYGPDGYTLYYNAVDYLVGAEELFSIRFKSCMLHGLLVYATNQEQSQYFVVGVSNSRIVVDFDLGRGLREVVN